MAEIYRNRLKWESEDGNTYIFDKNIGASVVGQDIYSDDEKIIGKFINGKPIYEKTISRNTLGNIDISDLNIESMVEIKGTFVYPTSNQEVQIGGYYGSYLSVYFQRPNELRFANASQFSNVTNIRVTIRYTKTTDTPNSYKPISTELTQEHLTGETYNGKPVYEKYVDTVVNLSTSGTTIPFNITNIDTVIDYDVKAHDMNNNWSNIGTFPTQYWNGNSVGVTLHCTASRPNSRVIAFVKYTKTID